MKLFMLLAPWLVLLLVSACSSGPEVRDTSHDNPKLVEEINRIASRTGTQYFAPESKFSPRRDMGWATYKLVDKNTNTVSILEVQVIPGPRGRRWIETKRISPTEIQVNRIEVSQIARPKSKALTQKAERVITWTSGQGQATEFPPDLVAASNSMAEKLTPYSIDVVTKDSPKKSVTVGAGKFPVCFVHEDSGVFLLKEAEEYCYSSQIPSPYIVLRESKSERQELLKSGWGSRGTFLPSHVRIIVDDSLRLTPKHKKAE